MFEQAGMETPKLGTVIIGVLTCLITVVDMFIIERVGRKPLMLASIGQLLHTKMLHSIMLHNSAVNNFDKLDSLLHV